MPEQLCKFILNAIPQCSIKRRSEVKGADKKADGLRELATGMCEKLRLKLSAIPSVCLPLLSTENEDRKSVNLKKSAQRQLRYEKISRKKEDAQKLEVTISEREEDAINSENVSPEMEEDVCQEQAMVDHTPSRINSLNSNEICAITTLLQMSEKSQKLDKNIQVVSGDLKLPYIIHAEELTSVQLKSLTGIPSNLLLNKLAEIVSSEIKFTNKHIIPVKERIIMVLMKIKLNISFSCLGIFFGCTVKSVSNIFSLLVPVLSSIMENFIEWVPKEKIAANLPMCFEDFSDVRVVLDCTEITVQKPKCLTERILTYSQYKGNHTLKYLVGVSPGGLITFISKGYGGRATDKHIVEDSRLIEMLEPSVDAVMTDKGFLIDDICKNNQIKLIRPPFLKQKKSFSAQEAISCKKIARARVHVERVIQQLKTFGILKSVIPYNLIHLIDQIMNIIAGLTNLGPPILSDEKY